jgi:pimeloyl-ACP methyl ester carboxylesterase
MDPKGIFLLFPGGTGLVWTPRVKLRESFPVVAHLFAEQGFVAAVVDAPSDQPSGFASGRAFRGSKEHAEDARKTIDLLSQKWPKPIFLLGHSSGGLSVAHIAITLKDERIKGIVLAATGGGLADELKIPLEKVTLPVLYIKHRHDDCSSFEGASQLYSRFIKSPRRKFIEVLGGDNPGNCGGAPLNPGVTSYTHYFSGKEREVVKAATDWAMGKQIPDRIGP